MIEKKQAAKPKLSADWLMRGALARLGDTVDEFTGRQWTPSSSLATSELIERLKKLLNTEAKDVPGKGRVFPHNIKLKMQWDKFSADAEESLAKLETELLAAAADHINDRLAYTFEPLKLEVKQDYFTEGVRLFVSFDDFSKDEGEAAMDVTLPVFKVNKANDDAAPTKRSSTSATFIAHYQINEVMGEKRLEFETGARLSVGRTFGNNLVLDDASVSKMHASLAIIEGALAVADTGSTNGTFINGERISYGKATSVAEKDLVRFGVVDVAFERIPVSVDEPPDEKSVSVHGLEFRSRDPEALPKPSGKQSMTDDTVKIEMDAAK